MCSDLAGSAFTWSLDGKFEPQLIMERGLKMDDHNYNAVVLLNMTLNVANCKQALAPRESGNKTISFTEVRIRWRSIMLYLWCTIDNEYHACVRAEHTWRMSDATRQCRLATSQSLLPILSKLSLLWCNLTQSSVLLMITKAKTHPCLGQLLACGKHIDEVLVRR